MLALNLPSFPIKMQQRNGKNMIFDPLRKKYVALTPEEWVRQHFIHFLTDFKGYPKGLLANEIQLDLNGTKKRCDTVLYNKDLSARMIVEYKAPHIEITQAVFDQITRYNMVLKVDYLIVSNGLITRIYKKRSYHSQRTARPYKEYSLLLFYASQFCVYHDTATVFAYDNFLARTDIQLLLGRNFVEATATSVTLYINYGQTIA